MLQISHIPISIVINLTIDCCFVQVELDPTYVELVRSFEPGSVNLLLVLATAEEN